MRNILAVIESPLQEFIDAVFTSWQWVAGFFIGMMAVSILLGIVIAIGVDRKYDKY